MLERMLGNFCPQWWTSACTLEVSRSLFGQRLVVTQIQKQKVTYYVFFFQGPRDDFGLPTEL